MFKKLFIGCLVFSKSLRVFFLNIINVGLVIVKKVFTFFLGILLIFLIIFNRFFRERVPADIPKVVSITSWEFRIYFTLFIICVIIFLFFVALIINPGLFIRKATVKQNKAGSEDLSDIEFANLILKDIRDLIINALRYVHLLFGDQIPNYLRTILYLSIQFSKLRPYYLQLICIFVYLPYLLVPLFFAIDIVYLNKFDYFYKALYLLIFPVVFNTLIGIFRQTYDLSAPFLYQLGSIYCDHARSRQLVNNNETFEDYIKDAYQVSSSEEFEEVFVHPATLLEYNILSPIDKLMQKYARYISVVTFFLYSIGWGYLVFQGFF
jgi:hypothetical protein